MQYLLPLPSVSLILIVDCTTLNHQPHLTVTMPRAHTTKFKDEHHIFVKNVPADLGISAVPNLFEQHKPTRIKNVYPTSNITTIVVTFATYEEAQQAQEEIDGTRLEHVVLRVEMYDKRRSVRYLKETRNTHRPYLRYIDEQEEDYEEEIEQEYEEEYKEELEKPQEPAATYALPFGSAQRGDPTTWARVVGKNRGAGMVPLPPPTKAAWTGQPTPKNGAPWTEKNAEVAILHQHDGVAPSEHGSTDVLPLSSEISSSTETEPERGTENYPRNSNSEKAVRTSIFVPWESFISTERIIQRHCRNCAFCQKRLA